MAELNRFDLRPSQNAVIEHIKKIPRCANWVFMGGGKSVCTLTAFVDLVEQFDARRMLVIAPKRVARSVWSREVRTWSHLDGLRVTPILGTAQERYDALDIPADVHTINRENVAWLEAQFLEGTRRLRPWLWDTVVLDESQSFRTKGSARSKALWRLRPLTERLIELTGTPAPNGYMNLWNQIRLLDGGHRLGRSQSAYRERWFEGIHGDGYTKWVLRDGAKEEIHTRVADIVFSLDEDVDAPPVMFNPVRVSLPAQAMEKYRKFERESLIELRGQTIIAPNAGACYGKLLQMANGAVYYSREGKWVKAHNVKIDTLLELLESIDGPTLICYGFKHDLARLKNALTKFCRKHQTWDVLKTQASEDNWNAGLTDYLLLHPKSAGHGLNLQHSGSEAIVWFGLTNDLEMWQQANARLTGGHRRTGRNIVVHVIVADQTIDERTLRLLSKKKAEQSDLISALSAYAKSI